MHLIISIYRAMKHEAYKMPSVGFFLMYRISDSRSCSSAMLIVLQHVILMPLVMRI